MSPRTPWVLAAALAGVAVSCHAAHAQLGSTRIGITAGVNFATLRGADAEDTKPRVGIALGGAATLPLGSWLSLETGLAYSQQGAEVGGGDDVSATLELPYLQIPALVRLTIPTSAAARFTPYLVVGTAVGVNLGCRLSTTGRGESASVDCDAAGDTNVRTSDVSLVTGAGVDVGRLTLGLRYLYGLATIDGSRDAEELKNRVLSLSVGFTLPLAGGR
jgi:hypothetical protein